MEKNQVARQAFFNFNILMDFYQDLTRNKFLFKKEDLKKCFFCMEKNQVACQEGLGCPLTQGQEGMLKVDSAVDKPRLTTFKHTFNHFNVPI